MKIPKVFVDIGLDPSAGNTSVYIEVGETVSDYLMAYIRAAVKTCYGIKADHRARDRIKYTIDSHLVYLTNTGQLFQDIDGTWDVEGFLWVNNEY